VLKYRIVFSMAYDYIPRSSNIIGSTSQSMSKDRSSAPRLFIDAALNDDRLRVGEREAHYLSHVLRLKAGGDVVVFNGRGKERLATVSSLARRGPELRLGATLEPLDEPPLDLVLVQALLKSDAMDAVVQKATELGVRALCAVKTDFSVIKLDAERAARRVGHWERIARSACEQSGRHRPPSIRAAATLDACLAELPAKSARIVFHRGVERSLSSIEPGTSTVCLLVGPEGGLSPADLEIAERFDFVRVGLGPRILRADTAAMTVCSAAQLLWGDLG
jgi:16S rRNA (uracil1498-N3)-methyltransferase